MNTSFRKPRARVRQSALATIGRSALSILAVIFLLCNLAFAQSPGGFIEPASGLQVRPRLTASQIQSFLPATRGEFTFPAPYNTEGIRITLPSDCGGADCVNYVGYSYWANINNHVGTDTMLIFLGLDRTRGGVGPTLFSYNKVTDVVTNLGPLFPSASVYSWHSGQGWYFSGTQPTKLYVYNSGARLLRYDVLAKTFATVFDISAQFGTDKYIFQVHSSSDDKVHSFTLRQTGTWAMLGCAVYREDTNQFLYYPKIGDFDECHIDKSGRWLTILENVDGIDQSDNRIIDIQTGSERVLTDREGGGGHADSGYGYWVGADNYAPFPNSIRLFDYGTDPIQKPLVTHNTDWFVNTANHIAHNNAQPGVPFEQQYACGSNVSRQSAPRGNEIVCFRLDTSLDVLVVADVMTDLDAPGGGDDYAKMPKGNIDVTGQYFIWTSNMGGNRLDAFIVKVPAQLLTGVTSLPPPPPSDTTPPVISGVMASVITSSGATIAWTTNELSDSQLEYGLTTAYGSSTPLNTSMVTSRFQTLSGMAPNTLYHYRVKSRDAAGNLATSGDFTFTTLAGTAPPGEIIIDNAALGAQDSQRTFTGSWCTSLATNSFGANSLFSCGAGTDTYRWTPTIPANAAYDVYIWWSSHANRSTNVPVTVVHAGGSTTRNVNQQTGGGQWVLHGRYTFNAGTAGSVQTSDVNGQAAADAVRWVRVTTTPLAEIIIDNAPLGVKDSQRTFSGTWCVSGASGFFGANSLYSCGSSRDTYRWTPTIPATAAYDVYIWWTPHPARSTKVPVTVVRAGGSTTKNFNQQTGGGQWVLHGRYTFNAGTAGYVQTSDVNGMAAADAVRWVPVP